MVKKNIVISCITVLCFFLISTGVFAGTEEYSKFSSVPEWEVLKLVNQERAKENVKPLTMLPELQRLCDTRAEELHISFSHTRPDDRDWNTVFETTSLLDRSYSIGENIAYGYKTAEDVMNGWMNSYGHRRSILNSGFDHIGVGYSSLEEKTIPLDCQDVNSKASVGWVQLFYSASCSMNPNTCKYSHMELILPDSMQFNTGTAIKDMNIIAVLDCVHCGKTYLPVLDEYCTGYNPMKTGNQKIKLTCLGFESEFSVSLKIHFNDVSSSDWFAPYVYDLAGQGIISGMTATIFAPDALITRAQFAKILAAASGEDLSSCAGKTSFNDVPASAWYASYVQWAYEKGVVSGMGGGRFAPESQITREQMAAMIFRYAAHKKITLPKTNTRLTFKDDASISGWAKENVYAMQQADIIHGYTEGGGVIFYPKGNAKRSEAATMVSFFLKLK